MAEAKRDRLIHGLSVATAWIAALAFFFPIPWMILTSLKTELQAISVPPVLTFAPTLEHYGQAAARGDVASAAWTSVVTSVGGTALAMLLAIPGAYALAIWSSRWTKPILLGVIATKCLPAVALAGPIYLICRQFGLLETKLALVVIFALINLPIIMAMLFSYFREIPAAILEASRMDGASAFAQFTRIVLPLSWGGLLATALVSVILLWNESFWSHALLSPEAGTLAVAIATFSDGDGLYWAQLSAISTLACLPILLLGWLVQRHLVRGLTFGVIT